MGRPSRSNGNSVSLFPFLAVLVCTMGSLIFLLILVTSRIRADAVAKAAEGRMAELSVEEPDALPSHPPEAGDDPPLVVDFAPEPAPTVEPPAIPQLPAAPPVNPHDEPLRERNAEMERRLAAQQTAVDQQRRQIEALRRKIVEVQEKRKSVDAALSQAKSQAENDYSARERLDEERRRLENELVELNRRIRLAQKKQNDTSSKYTFVPYDGNSGTTRRPILVECTATGIRFIPEDVALTPSEVAGFSEGFNPLSSGAMALGRYWATVDGLNSKGEPIPDPYVLLIVRPSGTVTYYYARKMLSKLRQPHGYELLDDGRQLDLPAADSKAKEIVQTAVNEALAKRDAVLADLEAGGSRISDGLPGGDEFPAEPGGNEFAPVGRAGRPGGTSGKGGREIKYRPGVGFEVVEGEKEDVNDPFGRAVEAQEAARSKRANVATSRNTGGGSGRNPGAPGRFTEIPGSGSAKPIAGRGSSPAGTEGVGTAESGESPFEQALKEQADSVGPGAGTAARAKEPKSSALADSGTGGNSSTSKHAVGAGPPEPGSDASRAASPGSALPGEPLAESQTPPEPGRGVRAVQNGNNRSEAPAGSDGTTSPQLAQGSPTLRGPGTGTARRTPDGKLSGSQTSGRETGSDGSASGSGSSEDSGGPGAQFGPQRQVQTPRRPEHRKWGIYSRRASIGFERNVRVQADADRLIVGRDLIVPIEPGISTTDLAENLAKAIDDEAHSWGRPPDSFYWVPAVKFTVSPGGNQHVERLRGPLKQWGLTSSVQYTFDGATPPQPPEKIHGATPQQ